jgi:hypothetical protein
VAVKRGERGKAGVVEPERHADAEHRPGGKQHDGAVAAASTIRPAANTTFEKHQHAAPAVTIDDPPDRRAGKRRDQQSARERRENP